jgi:hypothetical protein
MTSINHFRRMTLLLTVAIAVLGLLVGGCSSSGSSGLDDGEASDLVDRVLAGLDLPGEVREPVDPSEIPAGELESGFHCPVQAAGLKVDDVVVAFPPAHGSSQSLASGDVETVDVAIMALDKAASATAMLGAYATDAAIDCYEDAFDGGVSVTSVDPLSVAGVEAKGFLFSPHVPDPSTSTAFAVTLGRYLVDVSVHAPDDARRRELAAKVMAGVVDDLRAGGA